MDGVWIPVILFFVIGLCVVVGLYFKFKSRQELQMTVRQAIDSGQSFTPEALRELTESLFPPRSDLRRGVIWTAVGLAFIAFAFMIGTAEPDEEAFLPLLGLACFPLFVGGAYLILSRMQRDGDAEID